MFTALILGIVEGLTEFLPVSSTGHLILFGSLLKFTGEKAATFEIFIQLGAILAVVWLYRERFTAALLSAKKNIHTQSKNNLLLLLFFTTIPALIFGFLFHDSIKEYLFNIYTVAAALIFGGVIIVIFETFYKEKNYTVESLSIRQAFVIGLFQSIAIWPGVSRSAATIIGSMLLGLRRKDAVEYSFFVAVPVMFAATGYDLLKSLSVISWTDVPFFVVGFVASFISAALAIKFFIQFVQKTDLKIFGWYRILLGICIFAFASAL